jgi:ParB family chromosome partitioning protein
MADVGIAPEPTASEQRRRAPDLRMPIERIKPNPNQPRRQFDEAALEELAQSIRAKGIIQPLVVRPIPGSEDHEIVAGERRWRAAQRAQLHEVPVVVREFTDVEVIEVAIIENIQRADLNPLEEALGFRQLMDVFGHTQEKLAEALSKSRSHIANTLRLLNLPEEVQAQLRAGSLSAGHARALIGHPNAVRLAQDVVEKGLSVRETERLVKSRPDPGPQPRRPVAEDKDADTRALEGDLSANLGMSVLIDHGAAGEGGTLRIRYRSLEDLDFLCQVLALASRESL